jgi:hypothetical protein
MFQQAWHNSFQKSGKRGPQFGHQLRGLHWPGLGMRRIAAMSRDAAFDVIRYELDAKRIQRGTHCRDLIENIHAVPILIDHALDSGDLSGNAFHPALGGGSGFSIH